MILKIATPPPPKNAFKSKIVRGMPLQRFTHLSNLKMSHDVILWVGGIPANVWVSAGQKDLDAITLLKRGNLCEEVKWPNDTWPDEK